MAPDYRTLIDAETWAFIDRINSFYPPEAFDLPIARNREIYEQMCGAFRTGHPMGVTAETTEIPNAANAIPARIYRSATPDAGAVVLYLHGGGFVLGGLDSHDDICADICDGTGYDVVSVAYRLAPEHTHTAAFDDAMIAFEWLAAEWSQGIVLVGESAGGTLAACVAHHTRRHKRAPIGQILIYPNLGGDMEQGSYVTHADAPMLTARELAFYRNVRTSGTDCSDDPRYTPLAETDFSGLPPTAVFTAECDPLSSDGETYRNRLLAAGGKASWWEEPGLVHGYLRARHTVGRAQRSFERIVTEIAGLGKGN